MVGCVVNVLEAAMMDKQSQKRRRKLEPCIMRGLWRTTLCECAAVPGGGFSVYCLMAIVDNRV